MQSRRPQAGGRRAGGGGGAASPGGCLRQAQLTLAAPTPGELLGQGPYTPKPVGLRVLLALFLNASQAMCPHPRWTRPPRMVATPTVRPTTCAHSPPAPLHPPAPRDSAPSWSVPILAGRSGTLVGTSVRPCPPPPQPCPSRALGLPSHFPWGIIRLGSPPPGPHDDAVPQGPALRLTPNPGTTQPASGP